MKIFLSLMLAALSVPVFAEGPPSPPDASQPFVFSQLFDTDTRVRKAEEEKRWFFALTGMYARKNGNTDTLDSSLSSSVRFDDNIVEGVLSYSGSYGETKSVRDENKGSVYAGLDWYLVSRFELFFYSQSDYDRMTDLAYRNVSGGGGKLVFVRNRFWKADLSGAPVYQFEKYSGERADREWRWSVRGRVTLAPESELLRLHYVYFYIPSMGDSREYRQSHEFSVLLTPGKALLLKAGYRRDYDASVPDGRKKADSKYYAQAGLSL